MRLNELLNAKDFTTETYLLNQPFTVTHDRALYNEIRSKYQVLSASAASKFAAGYEKFKTVDEMLDSTPSLFIDSISDVLNEILMDIISIGIYDIDKDKVVKVAFGGEYFNDFSDYFKSVLNSCDKIYRQYNVERESHNQNYQYAGNWSSVTIGGTLFDAWNNQIQADALNLTENLAVAGINAILDAASEASARSKLKDIFESPSIKSELVQSVYNSAFRLHFLLIDLVNSLTNVPSIPGVVSKEDSDRARAMFNNFATLVLDAEKQKEFIQLIFSLDPYQNDYYRFLIQKYGDSDHSISDLSSFFTVNTRGVKNELLTGYVQKHLGATENDAKQCYNELNGYAQTLGVDSLDGTEALQIITSQQRKLDREFRTVDGVVFKTRDEAAAAKEEYGRILDFMKDVHKAQLDSDLTYEEHLLEQRAQLDSTFQTKIKDKYLKLIDDYDNEFDQQFRKVSFLKTAETREEAAKEKAYLFVKSKKCTTMEDIENAYSDLENEFLPGMGITISDAVKATDYLNKIQGEIENGVSQEGFQNLKIGFMGDQSVNDMAKKASKGLKGLFKKK